ncbi:MAG: hypothetical protein ACE366_01150 [Bradymonadia bacterium]
MSDLRIDLDLEGADLIRIRCDARGLTGTSEAPWAGDESLAELEAQVRLREAAMGASREMSALLGRLLFGGEAGAILREALATDPESAITLTGSERLLTLPWELARDPETGHLPTLDGATFVRVIGSAPSLDGAPRRGILTIPAATGAGRLDALTAVTRSLARKAEVDVFPSEPVTGLGLRRALSTGALFIHYAGLAANGALLLDDGKVPLERTGLNERCWMAVIAGTRPAEGAGPALRALGTPLVVQFQRELAPKEIGAFNQAFYKALATGCSVATALQAGRARLVKASGAESFAWMAPIVWSAPGLGQGDSTALEAFPPPSRVVAAPEPLAPEATRPAMVSAPVQSEEAGLRSGLDPVGYPFPAPNFIHDTLRRIQDAHTHGGGTSADLEARVTAMRALGTGATAAPEGIHLSPAERTAQLADHLVDAITHSDEPLAAPFDLKARVVKLAEQLGVDEDALLAASRALLSHRAINLTGLSSRRRRQVAEGLTALIYDRHPVMGHSGQPHVHIEAGEIPRISGWAWQAVSLNWRRDELDPLQPGQRAPQSRVPVVVQSGGEHTHYAVRQGAWVIVTGSTFRVQDQAGLASAFSQSVLSHAEAGHQLWLPLSADFRLIFTDLGRADFEGVPTFELTAHSKVALEARAWLADIVATTGHGAPEEHQEACLEHTTLAIHRLRLLAEIPGDLGRTVLSEALWSDEPPVRAVDQALARAVTALSPGTPASELVRDVFAGRFESIVKLCDRLLANQGNSPEEAWSLWFRLGTFISTAPGADDTIPNAEALKAIWWALTPTPREILQGWMPQLKQQKALELPLTAMALTGLK